MVDVLDDSDIEKIAMSFGIILAFIILIFVTGIVNERIKKKYNFNINGLSIAMFFSLASLGLGIGLLATKDLIGIVFILLFIIITGVVAFINIKKHGVEKGIKFLLLETVLSFGSLVDISSILNRIETRRERKASMYNEYTTPKNNFNQYINNSINRQYENDEEYYENSARNNYDDEYETRVNRRDDYDDYYARLNQENDNYQYNNNDDLEQ